MSHNDLFPPAFAYSKPREMQRLSERHKRIIEPNIQWIRGKRILDLATSNGRWVWAALNAGASFVTGVEGRADSVAAANRNLTDLGYHERSRVVCSDIYDFLYQSKPNEYDTIFCLGIYYHIMDHYMLMKLMARLAPEMIIIDSGFLRSFDLMVSVHAENPSLFTSALPKYEDQKSEIVGVVSLGLMIEMAANFGYKVEPVPWNRSEIQFPTSVPDYLRARRFTLRLARSDSARVHSAEWKARWAAALSAIQPGLGNIVDAKNEHPSEDLMTKYQRLKLEYEELLDQVKAKAAH